jgi:cytochrome b involved in lipid metabolism
MKKQAVLKDRSYRLIGATAPLSYSINTRNSSRKQLLHFDGQTNRALRYASNQKSPFEDEQDGNAILEPVVFERGMLIVQKTNPVLQEFLSLHPGNGSIFAEVDGEKDASVEVENLDYQLEAQIQARDLNIEMLETIGRVVLSLNIDKIDPQDFLDTLNDPMLKMQNLASKFIDQKILTLKNNKKDIYFNIKGNKTKLISIPFGENSIYTLASFFQTDDGIEVMTMLESKLQD